MTVPCPWQGHAKGTTTAPWDSCSLRSYESPRIAPGAEPTCPRRLGVPNSRRTAEVARRRWSTDPAWTAIIPEAVDLGSEQPDHPAHLVGRQLALID